MSVIAPAPAAPARPRRAPHEPEPGRRRRRTPATARPRANRSPIAPGVAWGLLLTVLFGGIVALNVGALRSSVDASRLEGQAAQLRSQNAELEALVSQRSDYRRISMIAANLGMVHTQPPASAFLNLRPHHHTHAGVTTSALPDRHRPTIKTP